MGNILSHQRNRHPDGLATPLYSASSRPGPAGRCDWQCHCFVLILAWRRARHNNRTEPGLNRLTQTVPEYTSDVSPQAVINVGATGLAILTQSPETLLALQRTYTEAIRYTLFFSLVAACAAFPCALGIEWLNIRKVAESRRTNAAKEERTTKSVENSTDTKKLSENKGSESAV